jgi:NAD(P)-dependent dehydrogenase (short-subunit alcohol dehydrogenase family)
MVFAQESIKRMLEDHGEKGLAEGGEKKGTLIFTGTLGALRCNAEFGSYGASRGSVRQLAQALAKELSPKGIHVVVSLSPRTFHFDWRQRDMTQNLECIPLPTEKDLLRRPDMLTMER